MNVSDIQTRVKRAFGDESGVQVTDTDIVRWINDGQRHIVLHNESLLEKSGFTDVVAGQQEYDLPVDLLVLRSVSIKAVGYTSYVRLKGFRLTEFNEYIDGWDGNVHSQGVPSAYCLHAGKLELFPIPDSSVTNGLKIYYNRKPTEVVTSADTPDLPELYHKALVKYCMQEAYEMDEDWEAASAKNQDMTSDINLLRGREDWKQQDAYPTITVLAEDI